jgi:hypothetical protein
MRRRVGDAERQNLSQEQVFHGSIEAAPSCGLMHALQQTATWFDHQTILEFGQFMALVLELPGQPHAMQAGSLQLVADIWKEVRALRSICGAARPGPSFADITKDLPRKEPERSSDATNSGAAAAMSIAI